MSKMISELLGAEEPLFSNALKQLERISGNPSVDVRLTAEIIGKARLKTQELGLDPDDTTPKELYYGLLNRVKEDNQRIKRNVLSVSDDTDEIETLIAPMLKVVKNANIPKKCWALKRSVAKRLLKKMPPRNMMNHLGYRSIDSMFKNEPFDEMYTALRFSEGSEWLNEYNKAFSSVKASDFETREIQIVVMDRSKWVDLAAHYVEKKRHNVTHVKELGVIVIVPMHAKKMRGLPLKTLPLLFHYINEIRLYSAFFKLKSTHPQFGKEIVDTITAEPSKAAVIAGHNIHWRVIQRYFGKLDDEKHPEAFEPHVHPEDLHWRKAEDVLYELDPKLSFWQDLDYVGIQHNGKPIALNLMDVAFSYSNDINFEERYFYHFRESLWNEIFMRYMGESVLEEQILKQLDNDMVMPELLEVV